MTDTAKNKLQPERSALEASRPAQWRVLWETFKNLHPDWVATLPIGEAIYIIPGPIVKVLTSPRGGLRRLQPILSASEAKAEQDFEKICRGFGSSVIGACEDGPLQFALLFKSWNDAVSHPLIPDWGKDNVVRYHQQQLAYAGSLSFHKPYRRELDQLKQKWLALPEPKPATGPWWTSASLVQSYGKTETVHEYYPMYDVFRSRWHLATLVSWDVPWPMGPSYAMPIGLARTLFGQSGEFDYQPPYLDTPRQSIREKEDLARELAAIFPGLPELPSMRGIVEQGPGPSVHETSFRMWLVEVTVRRHYGNRQGISAALTRGFATLLSISEDHVKRLRRTYTRFLTP